jgi:hypothetical protein
VLQAVFTIVMSDDVCEVGRTLMNKSANKTLNFPLLSLYSLFVLYATYLIVVSICFVRTFHIL